MKDKDGWKIVKVTRIPTCDVCSTGNGILDIPSGHLGSSWCNCCLDCFKWHPAPEAAKKVGCKLELSIPKSIPNLNTEEVVQGKELTALEDMIMDASREVECPRCGEIHTLEPDKRGVMKCHGCGVKMQLQELM